MADHRAYLTLTPRDPLIARDGRPFGVGSGKRMHGLNWLYPSVVAGSLRTLLGKRKGAFVPEQLKQIAVHGPLPLLNGNLFLPRPLDCVVKEKEQDIFAARPAAFEVGEGWDLADGLGLDPVLLPAEAGEFKPAAIPAFWRVDNLAAWLADSRGTHSNLQFAKANAGDGYLEFPAKDKRFHLQMDFNSGAGKQEDAFFLTSGLDLNRKDQADPLCLALRAACGDGYQELLLGLDQLHPLGGERRLAHWSASSMDAAFWSCPNVVRDALRNAPKVRLVLATPAIFSKGWLPGWLQPSAGALEGRPPGSTIRLRLRGALLERWQPVSGWSLEERGPKPVRRLVPAGAVYFFEVVDGLAADLATSWLESVSDDEQDRRDGFGLGLWGVWERHA
jgi:CRISPR-associated protein Cmr3